jgi:hypothetical protein
MIVDGEILDLSINIHIEEDENQLSDAMIDLGA